MKKPERHIIVVSFNTTPDSQTKAITTIGNYVSEFLSKQSGFLGSRLHASLDGYSILHYAEWISAKAFSQAAELARNHPDLPALKRLQPDATAYSIECLFPPA